MRRALVMLLVVLACSPPAGGFCVVGGGGGGGFLDAGFGGGFPQVYRTDEEVSVVLSLAKNVDCEGKSLAATAVQTAVLGPDNLPLTHTDTGLSMAGSTYDTTVKLTPMVPGAYHLTARFDPNLGLVQDDIRVAENRTRREPVPGVTVPASDGTCDDYSLTLHDAVVCQRQGNVYLYRGGARVQVLTASAVAVIGDVIWFVNGGTVVRYVDTGGTPLPSPTSQSTTINAFFLTGTADEITLVEANKAQRFVFENGMLVPHETWAFALSGGLPTMAASVGGKFSVMNESSMCVSASMSTTMCRSLPFGQQAVAFDSDGLWRKLETGELGRWAPGASSPVTILPPAGTTVNAPSPSHFGNRPLMTDFGNVAYTVADGSDPYLIEWTPKAGLVLMEIGIDWAAVRNSAGDVFFVR